MTCSRPRLAQGHNDRRPGRVFTAKLLDLRIFKYFTGVSVIEENGLILPNPIGNPENSYRNDPKFSDRLVWAQCRPRSA